MNNTFSAGVGRRIARFVALSAPIIALSLLSVGAASAAADEAFSPTQPIDAFADHWAKYHKDTDMTDEPGTILDDPEGYMTIHQEMFMDMVGQSH